MANYSLTVPAQTDILGVSDLLARADEALAGVHPYNTVTIRIEGFLRVSSIALVTAWSREASSQGLVVYASGHHESINYWERMQALKLFNAANRPAIKQNPSGGRFVEMWDVSSSELIPPAMDSILDFVMYSFVDHGGLIPSIEWVLGEMLDNILEHAHDLGHAVAVAQRYETDKTIEIAVVDRGIGLSKALSDSHGILGDEEAAQLAVTAGISSKGAGRGNGLAGTSQIAMSNGGTFNLLSGSALRFQHGHITKTLTVPRFRGTAATVVLNLDQPVDLSETLIGDIGWSYLDRLMDGDTARRLVAVRSAVETTATREAGRRLATYLSNLIRASDGRLQLDFSESTPTSAFAGELFKTLELEIPGGWQSRIELAGTSSFAKAVLGHALVPYESSRGSNSLESGEPIF